MGSLIDEQADLSDEFLWPDIAMNVALRAIIDPDRSLSHGALSGLIPPLPVSQHTGPLVRLRLQCRDSGANTAHRHPVYLLPFAEEIRSNGAAYAQPEGSVPLDVVDHVEIPDVGMIGIAGSVEIVCNPSGQPQAP